MQTNTTPTIRTKGLNDLLDYVVERSPFYKQHFKDYDTSDFSSLPFTTKQDIAAQNEDFCCVGKTNIAEYVTTSGTSGAPITIYLTKNDLDRLAENERSSLALMNGSDQDLYQLLTTMDKQFMAGLAYYLGVQKLEAGFIRQGPGTIAGQWDSILRYQPTKLIAVPSFIIGLIEYADANNIDYNATSIDSIVCIGESIRDNDFNYNTIGEKITSKWKINLYSTYASTEMATAFSECTHGNGGHLNEELLHLEVIQEDGTNAENGQSGEIVVSTLGVEGTPLVRYRTGDIATFWSEPCGCGLTSPRLGPIIGRKNQLIKYKGTSIYPQAIYNILNEIEGIQKFHIVVEQEEMMATKLSIYVSEDEVDQTQLPEIILLMKEKLKVTPEIEIVPVNLLKNLIFDSAKRKPNYITFK